MINRPSIWIRVGEWLLNHRWWLIIFAILGVFTFEFIEYRPITRGGNWNFFFEILFYGVVLPVSTGLALSWLAESRSELAWSTYYQNLKSNFDLQLYNAHSHAELASVILQFIRVVMPLAGASLYKFDQDARSYKNILNWSLNINTNVSNSISECAADSCLCMAANGKDESMILQACHDPKVVTSLENSSCFCIPFLFSNSQVAAARLYFPSGNTPSPEHIRMLKETAPEIASAFHRVQLERLIKNRDSSVNAEQQRIARDVHDTLGHSLAYLRLRLDQISMELNQSETDTLHEEVVALRDVAKEAYIQMREVLIALTPKANSNFNSTLLQYLDIIKKRSSFELQVRNQGKPRILPAYVQSHVFFIFREALTNIERHAHAKKVQIGLKWQDNGLELNIDDDGVGYDVSIATENGHFGLNNMQERAFEINANLSITSQPDHGSQIILQVPFEDEL